MSMTAERLTGVVEKFISERQTEGTAPDVTKIDWGRNSAVFRLGRKAIKFYTGDIDQPPVARAQVKLYRDVTNLASRLAEENDQQITLPQRAGTYPLRVNPIEELVELPDPGLLVSVSPFIEAPSAMTIFKSTVVDDPRRILPKGEDSYDWRQHPEVNPIRRFLLEKGLTLPHQVTSSFNQVDDKFNQMLGTEGIFAGLSNIKVLFEPNAESLGFVVTDLCLEVTSLRRKSDDQNWRKIHAEKHGLP